MLVLAAEWDATANHNTNLSARCVFVLYYHDLNLHRRVLLALPVPQADSIYEELAFLGLQ